MIRFLIDNSHFWLIFVDDWSGWLKLKFLEFRSDAKQAIAEVVDKFERETGYKILAFQCDNAWEFENLEIHILCKKKKIGWQPAVPYAHEQNGVAEIINRILAERD